MTPHAGLWDGYGKLLNTLHVVATANRHAES